MFLAHLFSKLAIAANPFSRYTRDILKGNNFEIGEYTYGVPRVLTFGSTNRLTVGKFCSISAGVVIFLGGNHRADWISTYPFMEFLDEWPKAKGIKRHPSSKGDVVIGSDVRIRYGATILSGVTVGDGAVIGARAVVASNVEPYSIVAGNPARLIRKRFDDETILKLLEIKWWDWPVENIKKSLHIICSGNAWESFE